MKNKGVQFGSPQVLPVFPDRASKMHSQTTSPTVSEIINGRPLTWFQLRTIALCASVVVLDGFDTQCIGFLVPYISDTLNIPMSAFGPVLAAGLFGLMVGAMGTGPASDRWGRKSIVIVSTFTFAAFAIATAGATSLSQLLVLRFLTGLGLGGALPNAIALASEYTPQRVLRGLVSALSGGMAIGALVAGLASSVLIPHWGWQSVLYVGGAIPIVVAFILMRALPESVRFLTIRGQNAQRVSKILAQISPELTDVAIAPAPRIDEVNPGRSAVMLLFARGRAGQTLLLWLLFFMSLLTLYFIVSWLPALLRQAGMPASAGVTAITLFGIGGFTASILQGPLIRGAGAGRTLLVQFVVTAMLIGLLAFDPRDSTSIMAAAFGLGCCVNGAQAGLNALASSFYPTAIRATGIGWALGIGRVGSIIGPLVAGVLLLEGWSVEQIFLAGAAPAVIAAAALVASSIGSRHAIGQPTFDRREP